MDLIAEIKSRVDCITLFQKFWPDHHGRYDGKLYPCPFHGDSNPSMKVEASHAFCFGCKKKWDAIDLYKEHHGKVDIAGKEIGKFLRTVAQELGIPVEDASSCSPSRSKMQPKLRYIQERWEKASVTPLSDAARAYLETERCIPVSVLDELFQAKRLGFSPKSKLYDECIEFPVMSWGGDSLLSMQHIPIGGGRKNFVKDTPFKDGFFKHGNGGDLAVISEAVIDSISIYAACKSQLFLDVVSVYSASSYTKLKSIPVAVPVIFMDDDPGGIMSTILTLRLLGPGRAKYVDWGVAENAGKDANDLLKAGKSDIILQMVKGAIGSRDEESLVERLKELVVRCQAKIETKEYASEKGRESDFVRLSKIEKEILAPPKEKKDPVQREDVSNVTKKDGAYWKTEYTAAGPTPRKISNFTLSILRNFSSPSGMTRLIKIIHENGFSAESEVSSTIMVSRQTFAAWILGQGNFLFKGTQADLEKMWELELDANDGKIIYRPDHIGLVPRQGLWLFGDCAVKDGDVFEPDTDGIYWVDESGYQPMAIDLSETKEEICSSVPSLEWRVSAEVSEKARKGIVEKLKQNLGGFEAYLALGFVAGCAYLDEIFREYKFPILFIFGRRQCGKNTLANTLMSHWGLGEWSSDNVVSITKAALSRKLAYYSNIPVWVDEYRSGDPKCQEKDSLLRSAYDRVGGSKGTLGPGVLSPKVRAPLVVTGEGFPSDSALTSRCAMIQLSETRRKDDLYNDIKVHMPNLSAVFLSFLRNKTPGKAKKLLEQIEKFKKWLESEGMDPRLSSVYATLGTSFLQVYHPEIDKGEAALFMDWICKEAHTMKVEKEEKLLTHEFLYDMEVLRDRGALNGSHVAIENGQGVNGWGPDLVFIWLKAVYNVWAEDRRRRGESTWSYQDLQKYFREEPYFVEDSKVKKIRFSSRRAMVFKWDKIPVDIQAVFKAGWLDIMQDKQKEKGEDQTS